MTSLGTGWWLLTIRATASSAGAHRMQIRLDNGTTSNYAGNGGTQACLHCVGSRKHGKCVAPLFADDRGGNPSGAVFSSGWDDALPAVCL